LIILSLFTVALLAKRGKCSVLQKVRAASNIRPLNTMKYLIIYGDEEDDDKDDDFYENYGKDAITTTQNIVQGDKEHYRRIDCPPETKLVEQTDPQYTAFDQPSPCKAFTWKFIRDDDINIAVLYISHRDGLDLINELSHQSSESYQQGGFRILLDGFKGWVPGYDPYDAATIYDIIIITALMFICCLSMSCLFSTNVQRVGAVLVVEAGDQERRLPGRYRHGLRLLNPEEVENLPLVEFGLERVLDGTGFRGACLGNDDKDDGDGDSKNKPPEESEAQDLPSTPLLSTHDDDGASSIVHGREHFQDISCTICLEDYEDGENLRVLPCQHVFHNDCIIPWLTDRAPTCPLCKALLEVRREGDSDVEDSDSDDESSLASGGNDEENDEGSITREHVPWYSYLFTTRRQLEGEEIESAHNVNNGEEAAVVDGSSERGEEARERTSDRGDSRHRLWSRMLPRRLMNNFVSTSTRTPEDDRNETVDVGVSLSDLREPLLEADSQSGDATDEVNGIVRNDDEAAGNNV
jgi:hypothetical protein